MIDRTREKEYIDHIKKMGLGEEAVYQARALCHIADVLTVIASDIRALRETNTTEGNTR